MRKIGFFPLVVCGYAIYYVADVWGGKFETIGYGLLCGLLVLSITFLLVLRTASEDAATDTYPEYSAKAFGMFVLLALYVGGQVIIGFPIATLLFLAALLWVLGYRRPVPWVLTSFGMAAMSYVILVKILGVPLPSGTFLS